MELDDIRCLAVLGLCRSGRPAALLGRRRLPAARVVALDEGDAPPEAAAAELRAAGVEVLLGRAAVLPFAVDLLVKSPGVPNESPAVREACLLYTSDAADDLPCVDLGGRCIVDK